MNYRKATNTELQNEWFARWNPEVIWMPVSESDDMLFAREMEEGSVTQGDLEMHQQEVAKRRKVKYYTFDSNEQMELEDSDISLFEAGANSSNQERFERFKAKVVVHGYSQSAIDSVRFVQRREYLEREIKYYTVLVGAYGDPDGELTPRIRQMQRELQSI